ncbi:MAG: hypothetical protein ACXAEU_15915 [Candidatus Hodarchaeales archaeon]
MAEESKKLVCKDTRDELLEITCFCDVFRCSHIARNNVVFNNLTRKSVL